MICNGLLFFRGFSTLLLNRKCYDRLPVSALFFSLGTGRLADGWRGLTWPLLSSSCLDWALTREAYKGTYSEGRGWREGERETDRQIDRQRDRERERDRGINAIGVEGIYSEGRGWREGEREEYTSSYIILTLQVMIQHTDGDFLRIIMVIFKRLFLKALNTLQKHEWRGGTG